MDLGVYSYSSMHPEKILSVFWRVSVFLRQLEATLELFIPTALIIAYGL